jgi:RNA polymerase sigma factor (sigma-70 family)
MPLSDADLLVRVLADDDRHAFAELVRRHQSDVRGLLRRLTGGDGARADDLAQETFLKAYRSLASFRGQGRFQSWLFGIAYRAFLSDVRRKSESPATERQQAEAPHPEAANDPGMRYDLERALALLRPEERAALALTFGQGLPHEEAAEILQCPLGTLKTHVNRGKARLRELLQPEGALT